MDFKLISKYSQLYAFGGTVIDIKINFDFETIDK